MNCHYNHYNYLTVWQRVYLSKQVIRLTVCVKAWLCFASREFLADVTDVHCAQLRFGEHGKVWLRDQRDRTTGCLK